MCVYFAESGNLSQKDHEKVVPYKSVILTDQYTPICFYQVSNYFLMSSTKFFVEVER